MRGGKFHKTINNAVYFAYGSNMNLTQMKERCGVDFEILGVARLEGHEFGFDSKGYANIRPQKDSSVFGVLFLISRKQLEILDEYEGYLEKPRIYDRDIVEVKTLKENKRYQAWVYFEKESEFGFSPKPGYYSLIVEGAKENFFPSSYINFLENLEIKEKEIDSLAQIIWDYLNIHHEPQKADLIFCLCSNDLRVAEYAADLFLEGFAPWLVFSGGVAHTDDVLATGWGISEADKFAEVAETKGVPKEKILIENKATNTGENFKFTHELLKKKGIEYKSMILVQKPFMLRRTLATFQKQWPGEEIKAILTSPEISFSEYPNENFEKEKLISNIVGDMQRIKVYPKMGFQSKQEIPDQVWEAYEKLVALGFDEHIIK